VDFRSNTCFLPRLPIGRRFLAMALGPFHTDHSLTMTSGAPVYLPSGNDDFHLILHGFAQGFRLADDCSFRIRDRKPSLGIPHTRILDSRHVSYILMEAGDT